MGTVYAFLADGFEEIEALASVDVWRRAGLQVKLVSVTQDAVVTGAHGVVVVCDVTFEHADFADADLLFLPGGMPGAETLNKHAGLRGLLKQAASEDKYIAAICAAPMVLGGLGLLEGKKATCYPGFESFLTGAVCTAQQAVRDGRIVTGRGPGATLEFALAVVTMVCGEAKARELKEAMCVA